MKIVQLASFLTAFVDSSDRILSAHNEMLSRVERARSQAVLRPDGDRSKVYGSGLGSGLGLGRDRERQGEGRDKTASIRSSGSKCSEEKDIFTLLKSDIRNELKRNDFLPPVPLPVPITSATSDVTVTLPSSLLSSAAGGAGAAGGVTGSVAVVTEGTPWLCKEALDNLNSEYSDSDSLLSSFSHATKRAGKNLKKDKTKVLNSDNKPIISGISLSSLKDNKPFNNDLQLSNPQPQNNDVKYGIEKKGGSEKQGVDNNNSSSGKDNKNEDVNKSEVEVEEEVSQCSDDSFESAVEDLSPHPTPVPDPNPDPKHAAAPNPHPTPVPDPVPAPNQSNSDSDSDDKYGDEYGDGDGDGTSEDSLDDAEQFNELIKETESLRSQLMSNIRLVESDKSKADMLEILQSELSDCESSLRSLKISYIESLMFAAKESSSLENVLEEGRERSKEDEEAAEGTFVRTYILLFFLSYNFNF